MPNPLLSIVLTLAALIPTDTDAARVGLTPFEFLAFKSSLERFPTVAECRYWIDRADEHLAYIDAHILLFAFDRDDWTEYREQVIAWRGLWYELSICRMPPVVSEDLRRMQKIRVALGDMSYEAGYVSPPIASYFLCRRDYFLTIHK